MRKIFTLIIIGACLQGGNATAQQVLDGNLKPVSNYGFNKKDTTNSKDEKFVPIDVRMWKVDNLLGEMTPTPADTAMLNFQNAHFTYGKNGEYNMLGNFGSPRLSRIFQNRTETSPFLFMDSYSYWLIPISDFLFTNTKSPYTNLTYTECGNRTNGEDRIRAYFATNINKRAGLGFKLDYLYGRGYYNSQSTSLFNATLFGYYTGEHYSLHAMALNNHMKMAENGGIENDDYITKPESFTNSYGTTDIPTLLDRTWNRNDQQTYFLTHHYNVGINRMLPLSDSIKQLMPADSVLLMQIPDTVRKQRIQSTRDIKVLADSLRKDWIEQHAIHEFVPVTSFVHTMQLDNYQHIYQAHSTPSNYYANNYYGDGTEIKDETKCFSFRNTLGIQLREGFNKYAKAGLTAFATYQLEQYKLSTAADNGLPTEKCNENRIKVGGRLEKKEGRTLHYTVNGETDLMGEYMGDFNLKGKGDLNFKLLGDTAHIVVEGLVKNETPNFYFRRYQSQHAWWDNNLDKEFITQLKGTVSWDKSHTALTFGLTHIKNYTYLAAYKDEVGTEGSANPTYSNGVEVKQDGSPIEVITAQLKQNFNWGILHWDNDLTYQMSSNKTALPLPTFTGYSNLYIQFKIAHVLSTQLGGDVIFFTRYKAPDYVPFVNQFATQAPETAQNVGGKPICSAYINFHLKHCRFYVQAAHLTGNNAFMVPHYPVNPMHVQFGLSWNFFN